MVCYIVWAVQNFQVSVFGDEIVLPRNSLCYKTEMTNDSMMRLNLALQPYVNDTEAVK